MGGAANQATVGLVLLPHREEPGGRAEPDPRLERYKPAGQLCNPCSLEAQAMDPQEHKAAQRRSRSTRNGEWNPGGHPAGKCPPAKTGDTAGRGEGPGCQHSEWGKDGGCSGPGTRARGKHTAEPHRPLARSGSHRRSRAAGTPAELSFGRCSCQWAGTSLGGGGRWCGLRGLGKDWAAGSTGQMPRTESRAWEPEAPPSRQRESLQRPQPRPSACRWVSPTTLCPALSRAPQETLHLGL